VADRPPSAAGSLPWRALAGFLLIGLGCASLLAATAVLTREPIARNRAALEARAVLWLTHRELPPAVGSWVDDRWFTCDGQVLLRGVAPGYAGPIHWLLAAELSDQTPAIVRVLVAAHQETPGIADFLNHPEHPWLLSLRGRGVAVADVATVSGATITSRSLARSIAGTLAAVDREQAPCP
jgi:Na+-translocating ferredoxin:NAD+ oxidoreductase RnfG subunit